MRVALTIALVVASSVAQAQTATLQEQGLCAKQARLAFQNWKGDATDKKLGTKTISQDYQNHFSLKFNRCFILIEYMFQMGPEFVTSVTLMDAYERRVYASYTWSTKKDKKYWEVPPTLCLMTPASLQTTSCSSRDEFDEFVATYMEQ
jgi:hypothetical protein